EVADSGLLCGLVGDDDLLVGRIRLLGASLCQRRHRDDAKREQSPAGDCWGAWPSPGKTRHYAPTKHRVASAAIQASADNADRFPVIVAERSFACQASRGLGSASVFGMPDGSTSRPNCGTSRRRWWVR